MFWLCWIGLLVACVLVKVFGYLVRILFWLCWIRLPLACVLVKIFVLVTCIGSLVECFG